MTTERQPMPDTTPTPPLPISLTKSPQRELVIQWNDEVRHEIPFRALRDGCQCAQCNEERINPKPVKPPGELTVLSAAEARPLDIDSMKPVGNYAYSISFSDGHASGIFTLELLRAIGERTQ